MKKFVLINFLLFAFITVSCSFFDNSTRTATVKIQISNPTMTPQPTDTPTITEPPTPTSTTTPTPDLRVITESSEKFLLQAEDLPREGEYYLPDADWISPMRNAEIISIWGKAEGEKYLEKSGRLDGWLVYYLRGSSTFRSPEQIYHNIVQYQSAEGAQLSVREFNYVEREESDWEYMEEEIYLGDVSVALISKEMQPDGRYLVDININTAYRNYASIVIGYGWEHEVTLEYMMNIAGIVLEKLKAAPLSEF